VAELREWVGEWMSDMVRHLVRIMEHEESLCEHSPHSVLFKRK
jgi:hypothetical protein